MSHGANIQAVRGLRAGSCTNLSGGLLKALDHLKTQETGAGVVRRCMIFTDGQANRGITGTEALTEAVLEYRSGIAISAFGYGQNHSEDLLRAISQDGNFYYIDNPDKILAAFGAELGGLLTTYGQNVELVLTPTKGIRIIEVMNDLTVDDQQDTGGPVTVTCDDLLAGQPAHIVVRLSTEVRNKALPRKVTLVKAAATFYNVAQRKPVHVAAKLQVKFVTAAKADTTDNPVVMEEVALQKRIVSAQARAVEMADAGDYVGAQGVLRTAAAFATMVGTEHSALLGAMAEGLVAHHVARTYGAGGRKTSTSARRSLRRRSAGTLGTNVGGVDVGEMYASHQVRRIVSDFIDPAADLAASGVDEAASASKSKGSAPANGEAKADPPTTSSKRRSRSPWR